MKRFLHIFVLFFLINQPTWAEPKGVGSSPPSWNCVISQRLDSLKALNIFTEKNLDRNSPIYPDLIYEVKIAAINNLSPIEFDYNQFVKRYIDLYTLERREQVSNMLGLAELYFPIFDELLDKHQLPLELKYLAVVESALNPMAVSTSGAVGLWQFKINTARMFNLEVNSYIDERMDPVKSTEAACMYLKYLHKIFNDWHLVMAAYNAGPGPVRNAIIRSGGDTNFWNLYEHLPEAAQNYIPAFIAATYVMQNASAHNITPSIPVISFFQTDTIQVSKALSLNVLSAEAGIPLDVLRILNPIYRRGLVPPSKKLSTIRVPENKVQTILEKESLIFEKSKKKTDYHDILANAGSTSNKTKITHKVVQGDYLHKIGVKYNCTIDDILAWNPGSGGDLAIGQRLVIWVDKQTHQLLKHEDPDLFK
jgi:membrane-bound lytic murein transglycosylase D